MGAHPLKSATVAVVSAVATVGVAIAVLASGGGAGEGPHHATAPQLDPATGTIAFSRNTGEGTFEDSGGPTFQLAPGTDAIIGQTDAQNTCCLSPSAGVARFALASRAETTACPRDRQTQFRADPDAQRPGDARVDTGAWSHDGTLLAYAGIDRPPGPQRRVRAAKGSGHLVLQRTPGRPQRPLACCPRQPLKLLAFERNRAGDSVRSCSCGVERTEGGPPAGHLLFLGSPASWSPDGRSFAFAAFSMDPDTPGERPSSSTRPTAATPTASPRGAGRPRGYAGHRRATGSCLTATTAPGSTTSISSHPDGSGLHVIDTDPQARGACCAQWSLRDGRYLAYQHVENADEQHRIALYVVNVNGPPHIAAVRPAPTEATCRLAGYLRGPRAVP